MFYCICLTTRNGRGRLRGTLRLNARHTLKRTSAGESAGTVPAKVPFLRGFRFSQPVTPPPAALCHHRNANQKAAAKALGHFGKVAADHAAPKEQRAVDIVSGKGKSEGTDPGADFIFAAISLCFVKISAAHSRQPFISASSAPPETSHLTRPVLLQL